METPETVQASRQALSSLERTRTNHSRWRVQHLGSVAAGAGRLEHLLHARGVHGVGDVEDLDLLEVDLAVDVLQREVRDADVVPRGEGAPAGYGHPQRQLEPLGGRERVSRVELDVVEAERPQRLGVVPGLLPEVGPPIREGRDRRPPRLVGCCRRRRGALLGRGG